MHMNYRIKEQSLGGTLDQAVEILRDHLGLLMTIVGTTFVPFQAVVGLTQYTLLTSGNIQGVLIVAFLVTTFIGFPLAVFVNNALFHAISSAYLSRPTTVGQCFRHAANRFLPALGTMILTSLATLGGMLLCFIPGILFALWFSLAQQIAVLEGMGGPDALTRSRELMKGNMLTLIALGLMLAAIGVGIGMTAGVIPQQHLRIIASAVVQGIATLLSEAAMVVFYFSCRCKVENFDLELLARSVAASDGSSAESELTTPAE